MTGEDVAFCQAARAAGVDIAFAAEAILAHKDRDDLHDALRHHRRWGEHTHQVRTGRNAFLGSFVPRSVFASKLLAAPYAWAFTFLIVALWIRHDPRVLAHIDLIYKMKRAFTQGMVIGADGPTSNKR